MIIPSVNKLHKLYYPLLYLDYLVPSLPIFENSYLSLYLGKLSSFIDIAHLYLDNASASVDETVAGRGAPITAALQTTFTLLC